MINLEELYSNVPPTKLRNIDEKFCPAATSKFWLAVANFFFYRMLETRFYAFRYKGYENFLKRDKDVPLILFAPHFNWWDGIVGYHICNKIFKKQIRIMVEELNRFPILRHAGAFNVNKKSPQASMEALRYAVNSIEDLNNVLYIFPQGIIKPPYYRPIEFQTGLAYIAQKAVKKYGKVNLMPVSVNYTFLRDNRPEVLVELGEIIQLNKETTLDRHELTTNLAKNLEQLCDKHFYDISQAHFQGYETLFQQRLKWYRRIEQRLKRTGIKGSGI
ncbi:MAG: lysophospholipid acyltransferase family protein [bacterium]|nr:lysophospholipid acyltransferase family protein [bacterium]